MQDISELKPTRKDHVFDLIGETGVDQSDWINSSNDVRGPKANPKYCYEWSFVEPGTVVVLNLWYQRMMFDNGQIVQKGNFRADADTHRGPGGKSAWLRRATKLDEALQTALRGNLPVRVIINDGAMRTQGDPQSKPSKVTKRQLDPEPWTIIEYDWQTGEHVLARGILNRRFVDQFDIEQAEKADPARRRRDSMVFIRNPDVRDEAKRRSNGKCEFCGKPGFVMESGAIYLETHHIIPLSEGGADAISNVISLCPNDHRMAHYSKERDSVRQQMLALLPGLIH